MKKTFFYKKSSYFIFLSLSISSSYVFSEDCLNKYGCDISTYDGKGYTQLNVLPGQYEYKVPTFSEFNTFFVDQTVGNTSIRNADIFGVSHSSYFDSDPSNPKKYEITFQSGAEIIVDSSFLNNPEYGPFRENFSLNGLSVHGDSTKATLAKGVKFILKGQPEEFYDSGMSGIDIYNGTVESQADFFINSPNATAYNVQKNSFLDASNHVITFEGNSKHSEAILVAGKNSKAVLNNIKISGQSSLIGGLSAISEGAIDFNNSSINFDAIDSHGLYTNGGSININKSSILAGQGIALMSFNEDGKNSVINVVDSSITAKDALLSVNDRRLLPEGYDFSADEHTQQTLLLNAKNSNLTGRVYTDLAPSPNVIFQLNDQSSWNISGNSEINNLIVNNSEVSFSDGEFKTLTIKGNLSGENGLFKLNTNLADQQSDKIIVQGNINGQHKLSVSDSRKAPISENGRVTLVESQGGSGSFEMLQPYVDAGNYRYFFKQDGNNWILSNDKNNPSNPSNPSNPIYEISDFSNSLIGVRQAANQFIYQLQEPLDARLSDLTKKDRNQNFWMNSDFSQNHFDSVQVSNDLVSSGFKQKSRSFQIGYDADIDLIADQKTYLGVFLGEGKSNIDFNGNYQKGDLTLFTTGIYGGWQNRNNWFADVTYRYSYIKANAHKIDKTDWNANNLALRLGKQITLTDSWILIPNIGVNIGRLSGDSFSENTTSYRSQIGSVLKNTWLINNMTVNPYISAYWLHERNNLGDVTVDNHALHVIGAGNSGLYEAGLDIVLNSNNYIDFKTSYAKGQKTEQNLGINLNYRYLW